MFLAAYPAGFKIKSKADVIKAVSYMTKGMEHWIVINPEHAVCIDIRKDASYKVLLKIGDLHDIFNPTIEAVNPIETLWRYRKYINQKYFF